MVVRTPALTASMTSAGILVLKMKSEDSIWAVVRIVCSNVNALFFFPLRRRTESRVRSWTQEGGQKVCEVHEVGKGKLRPHPPPSYPSPTPLPRRRSTCGGGEGQKGAGVLPVRHRYALRPSPFRFPPRRKRCDSGPLVGVLRRGGAGDWVTYPLGIPENLHPPARQVGSCQLCR